MNGTGTWVIFVFSGVLLATSLASAQKSDYPGITNFLRVNDKICTGGQPGLDDLKRMKAEGIKAILNLRQPSEYNFAAEESKARELNLRYFSVPVDSQHPTDQEADEFLKILADPENRPVFIHCGSANRVGGFWMIRRVLVDGWKLDDAESEAEKIGLRSSQLREFARDYIRRHTPK